MFQEQCRGRRHRTFQNLRNMPVSQQAAGIDVGFSCKIKLRRFDEGGETSQKLVGLGAVSKSEQSHRLPLPLTASTDPTPGHHLVTTKNVG